MRYRIRHITTYRYTDGVTLSQNLAHLAPRVSANQQVLSHMLDIEPTPAVIRRRFDYFGNPTDSFTVVTGHHQLVVASMSEVEVRTPPYCDPEFTPPWDSPMVQGGGDCQGAWEYRFDSAQIPCAAEMRVYAASDFSPGRPVLAAALAYSNRINREFAYDPTCLLYTSPSPRD